MKPLCFDVLRAKCVRPALALLVIVLASGETKGQTASRSSPTENAQSRVLLLSPAAATRPGHTHAALVLSNTSFSGEITFRGRVRTVRQLRTGSPPNPWECAWLVWNYYGGHFYYLALKTNGWEIGKHDRAFPGNQMFLMTGAGSFDLGVWYQFEITQKENEIAVRINDVEVARLTDTVRPYTSGKFGFYTEDAVIQVDDITAPFREDFEDYPLEVHRRDGQVLKNWFMPFLGHGHAAIVKAEK